MAGDPAGQLRWYLSGGVGTVDADFSLGGARSNTQIQMAGTTVAADAAAGAVRVYLTNVLWGAQANAYVYFRTGNAGGWQSSVTDVDTGANWIDLLEPLPTSISIGDYVWFFLNASARNPFKNTSALESAVGITHYVGLYATNTGATLNDFRFWIERLNPGPVAHEIAASDDWTHTLVTIPNEETAPDLSTLLSGGAGRFVGARSYADGSPEFNFPTGNIGFWLKRTGPADAVRLSDQALAVVGESGGGVTSKVLLNWNTAGFTPVLELTHAPTVYLRGGARFKASVTGQETGLRVSGVPVGFSKTAGPGTLQQPPAPGETDENGEILARYAAPTDVGEIGNTVTVEAQV